MIKILVESPHTPESRAWDEMGLVSEDRGVEVRSKWPLAGSSPLSPELPSP